MAPGLHLPGDLGQRAARDARDSRKDRRARLPQPERRLTSRPAMTTAFVLGGGGLLGANEVGMLRALAEAGIRPDLVVGTSIGAINGAFVAADPAGSAKRLGELWRSEAVREAFSEKLFGPAGPPARSRTPPPSIEPLRGMLGKMLPAR